MLPSLYNFFLKCYLVPETAGLPRPALLAFKSNGGDLSCYEWEEGTLKIPSSEWSDLKKSVRDAYNILQRKKYKKSLKFYEQLIGLSKGQRGFDFKKEAGMLLRSPEYNDIMYISTANMFSGKSNKPLKPKKKDFPEANNRTTKFYLDGCSIIFNNETREALWFVPENNHARDYARTNPVAKVFLGRLEKIKWTTKTGGVFIGNDEYNQEARFEGGGGNYVTRSYGGIGDRAGKRRFL